MSLKGKNRAFFSYNGKDKTGSNFMYKDFEKSKSYNTLFNQTNFNGTSLRGASMKFCSFRNSSFIGTEFIGTNLRGSIFDGSCFSKSIFNTAVLDRTSFNNATFENCFFFSTGIERAKCFPPNKDGITFVDAYPPYESFSPELLNVVAELRQNEMIRRSHTLHLKGGKINTFSLMILETEFSEKELIQLLPYANTVPTQFYTLSYLEHLLKKKKEML